MKKLCILLLCLITSVGLKAEGYGLDFGCDALEKGVDSLRRSTRETPLKVFNSPSKFKYTKLILPSSPIIIGSMTLYVTYADELDMSWSDKISSGHGKLTFDDYLQYSPVAIMWGLNAFGNIKPYHKFKQQTTILLMSAVTSLVLVQGTKLYVNRRRPDTGASNSFPSGHTATAFLCAEMLHLEYGHHSPWISVAGYSLAAVTGYMRVYNERHYVGDIIAGAGIGMLSARLAYWVAPSVNRLLWGDVTGYTKKISASLMPCNLGDSYGLGLSVKF